MNISLMDTKKIILFVSIMVLALAPLLAGCGSSSAEDSGTDFKEVTVTKQGITFSFEYPENYVDGFGTLDADSPDPYLVNVGLPIDANISNQNPNLAIVLIKNNADAKTTLDKRLQDNQQKAAENQYQLIEQSSIKVSGIDAQMAAYSVILWPEKSKQKSVVREAFLRPSNLRIKILREKRATFPVAPVTTSSLKLPASSLQLTFSQTEN